MILVVGATGLLGGMIARRLLDQGRDVRILVRKNSPSEALAQQGMATSAQSLIDAGAQPVCGDLKDAASLAAAVRGIETVISTANSAMRGGEDNWQTVDLEGNRRLIDAAREAGVSRFIYVSAQVADVDSPLPFLQAKAQTEQHLRDSGMTYTILAPQAFVEIWLGMVIGLPLRIQQPVTLVGQGSRRHSFVAMADVAEYAVAALDHPAARNQHLLIGGPEALSFREAVTRFEGLVGREILVRYVGIGEPVPLLPPGAEQMLAGFEMTDLPIDMTETSRTFGIRPTPLEETARQMLSQG